MNKYHIKNVLPWKYILLNTNLISEFLSCKIVTYKTKLRKMKSHFELLIVEILFKLLFFHFRVTNSKLKNRKFHFKLLPRLENEKLHLQLLTWFQWIPLEDHHCLFSLDEVHQEKTAITFIIFWNFLMIEQIFLSPHVKRSVIISNKLVNTRCASELPNDLRHRILQD